MCGKNGVVESLRNAVLRWNKHDGPNKKSEPPKRVKYFLDHQFEPEYKRKRKNLEPFLIKSINPSLKEQLGIELLLLFRNGLT